MMRRSHTRRADKTIFFNNLDLGSSRNKRKYYGHDPARKAFKPITNPRKTLTYNAASSFSMHTKQTERERKGGISCRSSNVEAR